MEWLRGTPFSDYTIPTLLLVVAVEGSSLIAAVTAFAGREISKFAAMAASLILPEYIVVKVLILKRAPAGPTPIEILYFGLGLFILGSGTYLSFRKPS